MKFQAKFGIPIFCFDRRREQDYLKQTYSINIFIDGIADFIYELPLFCLQNQKYGNIKALKSFSISNELEKWKILKANNWFLDFKNKQIVKEIKNNLVISNNQTMGLYLGDQNNNFVSGDYDIIKGITTIYNIGNIR